jgi:hypothetical protein
MRIAANNQIIRYPLDERRAVAERLLDAKFALLHDTDRDDATERQLRTARRHIEAALHEVDALLSAGAEPTIAYVA